MIANDSYLKLSSLIKQNWVRILVSSIMTCRTGKVFNLLQASGSYPYLQSDPSSSAPSELGQS